MMNEPPACPCLTAPRGDLIPLGDFGMDRHFAEVSLLTCPDCGRFWLRYFYEIEAFSRSGRWYLGALSAAQLARFTVDNARELLEELDWYFYGGSYFDGKTGRGSGEIFLSP